MSFFFVENDYGSCFTPNGEKGLCINLKQCNELYNLLQKTPLFEDEKLFLRKSQCGWNNGDVLVNIIQLYFWNSSLELIFSSIILILNPIL